MPLDRFSPPIAGRSSRHTRTRKISSVAAPSAPPPRCRHFARRVALVAPCCRTVVCCHIGHDQSGVCPTPLIPPTVNEVVCLACRQRQPVAAQCRACGVRFADRVCVECRLFYTGDGFHCDRCGVCRQGLREDFRHCERRDDCFPVDDPGFASVGAIAKRGKVTFVDSPATSTSDEAEEGGGEEVDSQKGAAAAVVEPVPLSTYVDDSEESSDSGNHCSLNESDDDDSQRAVPVAVKRVIDSAVDVAPPPTYAPVFNDDDDSQRAVPIAVMRVTDSTVDAAPLSSDAPVVDAPDAVADDDDDSQRAVPVAVKRVTNSAVDPASSSSYAPDVNAEVERLGEYEQEDSQPALPVTVSRVTDSAVDAAPPSSYAPVIDPVSAASETAEDDSMSESDGDDEENDDDDESLPVPTVTVQTVTEAAIDIAPASAYAPAVAADLDISFGVSFGASLTLRPKKPPKVKSKPREKQSAPQGSCCPVCGGSTARSRRPSTTLACGHTLHLKCLVAALQKSGICPASGCNASVAPASASAAPAGTGDQGAQAPAAAYKALCRDCRQTGFKGGPCRTPGCGNNATPAAINRRASMMVLSKLSPMAMVRVYCMDCRRTSTVRDNGGPKRCKRSRCGGTDTVRMADGQAPSFNADKRG